RINAPGVTNASVEFVRVVTGNGASELVAVPIDCPLILEGELNKLAANISIGRNMAGVHYFTDYFDSARMGEEIAVGILEEQALGYQNDRFVKSLPTFDGDSKRIGRA
ncbi:MAG: bromoperoxidase, partial [Pseudomonadota bacterium]